MLAIPTDLAAGTYYLIAVVDAGDQIPETDEGNNQAVSAGTYDVVWGFGDIGAPRNYKMTLVDPASGDLVTFSLRGDGTGTVTETGAGFDIDLQNVSQRTNVTIRTARDGTATLDDVDIDAAMRSFKAQTADLVGTMTALGSVRSVVLGNVVNGTAVFSAAVNKLTALQWSAGSITMDVLGRLRITGRRANARWGLAAIPGNFGADLTVNNTAASRYAARSISVANWIDGADIRIQGNTGKVSAAGARNGLLFVGVQPAETDLPDAAGDFSSQSMLRTLLIRGVAGEAWSFINFNVAASNLGRARVVNVQTDNSGTPFGFAAESIRNLGMRQSGVNYRWPNNLPNMDDLVIRVV